MTDDSEKLGPCLEFLLDVYDRFKKGLEYDFENDICPSYILNRDIKKKERTLILLCSIQIRRRPVIPLLSCHQSRRRLLLLLNHRSTKSVLLSLQSGRRLLLLLKFEKSLHYKVTSFGAPSTAQTVIPLYFCFQDGDIQFSKFFNSVSSGSDCRFLQL